MSSQMSRACVDTVKCIGSILLLCSVAPFAVASDMGNGQAALAVWAVGTGMALIIGFVYASTRNELGALQGFNTKKFFVSLSIVLPIVFVAGIAAIFVF